MYIILIYIQPERERNFQAEILFNKIKEPKY